MKIKVLEKKKLYRGMTEIKDYELKKAIELGQSVKFIYNGEFMIVSPFRLNKDKIFINTQKSIINDNQTYAIYGFRWRPTGRLDEQVNIDFNTKVLLGEEYRRILKAKGL